MIRHRVFVSTVCAERNGGYGTIVELIDRYPLHLCIDNDEVNRMTAHLIDRWVQDGEAWDTAEEAGEALRESWLDFVPVSFGDVRWALHRRMMAMA